MSILITCVCGHRMKVPTAAAGKRGRCPKCQATIVVPEAPAATADGPSHDDHSGGAIPLVETTTSRPQPARQSTTAATIARVAAAVADAPRVARPVVVSVQPSIGMRRHLYWVLLLVLLPLAWSTFHRTTDGEEAFVEHIRQTVQHHPESAEKLHSLGEDATKEQLCAAFPDDRLDGALLPEKTWAHWGLAALSGAVFLAVSLAVFPHGQTRWPRLVGVGLLTGTLGILLLLAFQWLAFHMPFFTPRGLISILLDVVWLIGQSYAMALGDHGFFLSFLGFTAGVGLCEEACKAIPLLVRANHVGYESWRTAMLWGMISGIGFGVSEGITYSSDYYNGIDGPGIYLVRFVSCVGLHGIWAAAVGINIFRRQDLYRNFDSVWDLLARVIYAVLVPMVLHGLYDTLLKQQYDLWALVVAVASFGWLAFQIERAHRDFGDKGVMVATAT